MTYPVGVGQFCTLRAAPASGVEWQVYYGGPGGFTGAGFVADAPTAFPRVDQGIVTKEMSVADLPPYLPGEGVVVDIQDLDGDGWSDVIRAFAGEVRGHRGEGHQTCLEHPPTPNSTRICPGNRT